MTRRSRIALAFFGVVVGTLGSASAGTITAFSDRTTFNAALSPTPLTVETFGAVGRFPISTGTLNSATNLVVSTGPAIRPGDIQPGVTYSTAIGTGNFFNIDQGGGFVGGFLDSIRSPGVVNMLNVAFNHPTLAFGFDTDGNMGTSFNLDIHFTSGPDFITSLPVNTSGLQFFGFESTTSDIVSATIEGNNQQFAFAVDNFTFTTSQASSTVPEPSALVVWSMMTAAAGLGCIRKRRRVRVPTDFCT